MMTNCTTPNCTPFTINEHYNDVLIELSNNHFRANVIVEALLLSIIAFVALLGNVALWIIVLNKKFKLRKTSNAPILGLSGKYFVISLYCYR